MNPLLKKLNFKEHKRVNIINAPKEFLGQMNDFSTYLEVAESFENENLSFVLAFVTTQEQINLLAAKIDENLENDGLFWWAYPKGTSKRYKCNFNRDSGWQVMGSLGYEPVRMVAIDEDWSAFRFRKAEHIKKMSRSIEWRMSEEGKKK